MVPAFDPGEARDGARTAWRRGQPVAVFLLSLFALLWPIAVAETHHHLAPISPAAVVHGTGTAVARDRPVPDTPDACPVCQQLAHAGALLLPETLPLPVIEPEPGRPLVALLASAAIAGHRSHAWRSRAPPSRLQA